MKTEKLPFFVRLCSSLKWTPWKRLLRSPQVPLRSTLAGTLAFLFMKKLCLAEMAEDLAQRSLKRQLDISNLAPGTYFLTILEKGKKRFADKIIVLK